MTSLLLIRHAAHDVLGKRILGRTSGVHLNKAGRQQAEQLADRLSVLPIDAVFSSPLERARESAEPLACRLDLPVNIADEFNELDMGDWTNRTLVEMNSSPEWQNWNTFRSNTAPPNGEWMLDVQARAIRKIADLRRQFHCVAIFSHADVIRGALTYFLGMHLDLVFRIEIDPGSINLIQLHDRSVIVRVINAVPIENVLKPPFS